MRGRVAYLLYGVLALAVGIWLFGQLEGEERRIRERLALLEDLLEKDGEESRLAAASKARSVSALFTREFEVILGGYASGAATSAQEIAQAMLRYRTPPSRIEVGFSEVAIELDSGERGAGMTAIAAATATIDGSPSRRRFRIAFRWVKQDREWMIRRAELIEELDSGLF